MSAEQHAWWEEGCYCQGDCICGTSEDPFVEIDDDDRRGDG